MAGKSVAELKHETAVEKCRYCRGPEPSCSVCRGSGIVTCTAWGKLKLYEQVELLEKENADLRRQLVGPLNVEVARERAVCRVCRQPAASKPDEPFVLDFGKEFAHESCITEKPAAKAEAA